MPKVAIVPPESVVVSTEMATTSPSPVMPKLPLGVMMLPESAVAISEPERTSRSKTTPMYMPTDLQAEPVLAVALTAVVK